MKIGLILILSAYTWASTAAQDKKLPNVILIISDQHTGKIMTQRVSFVGRMVLTNRYKYILFDGGANREQLVDLQNDPGEISPVTSDPSYAHQLVAHRAVLRDWILKSGDPFYEKYIP